MIKAWRTRSAGNEGASCKKGSGPVAKEETDADEHECEWKNDDGKKDIAAHFIKQDNMADGKIWRGKDICKNSGQGNWRGQECDNFQNRFFGKGKQDNTEQGP